MKYKFEATQTIYKYFDVDADSEDEALDKANQMLNNGEVYFDDEPYSKIECNIKPIAH